VVAVRNPSLARDFFIHHKRKSPSYQECRGESGVQKISGTAKKQKENALIFTPKARDKKKGYEHNPW
jgi:hypothetical protein